MLDFTMIFLSVLGYIISLIAINLNTVMTYINHNRKDDKFNYPMAVLNVIISVTPVLNMIYVLVLAPMMREEIFLTSYLKGLNDSMKCYSCGIVTRRHLLKDFEPEVNWLGDYKYNRDYNCPHCEAKGKVYEREEYKNKNLPFGKRIYWISGILKYFTLGLNENQRKLKDLKEKQSELEFADNQMEKWHRLQEDKLKRMERKVAELKKEMNL